MPEPNDNILPDNPTDEQLEAATNAAFSDALDSPQARALSPDEPPPAPSEPGAAATAPAVPGSAAAPAAPASPQSGQVDLTSEEKTLLTELRALQEISGTPFKTPADLVRSYKELQSTYTRDHEFVTQAKPHRQLVDKMLSNPAYAQFIEQATAMFENPQLAAPYLSPGQADAPPDPRSFDMFDPAELQKYNQELANYHARQIDSRLNARFSQTEAKAQLDRQKAELKTAFPSADPDAIVERIQERAKKGWSIIDGYKVLEFDNMKTRALEEARAELNQKLATAAATGTPPPSAPGAAQVTLEQIVLHINKYGGDSARKHFGDRNYQEALRASAEMAMQ